jgi:hypothetical protein
MNFKIKCLIQWIASCLPQSTKINRLLQIYVSRSLPISDSDLNSRIEIAEKHINSYLKKRGVLPASILDIGSGSDLSLPLLMKLKISKVVASDVNRLANKYLIENMIDRIGSLSLEESGLEYIVYNPPRLPFSDESFDLITSTSVLEHIPRSQMPVLANEIHRLLKCSGISTHHIAHKDHWSDSDPSLHPMNYLKYSEWIWKCLNPPLLHQNRLLSSDFKKLFEDSGFNVERDLIRCPPPEFKISESFSKNTAEDFSVTHTWLVLDKSRHDT